ncbi:MAG: cupin domain-containing protein [Planctomycetes bacterium]|nr:cupin domain-containing protein [Planctomycetota bacterium]
MQTRARAPLRGVPGKWTARYLEDAPEERTLCGSRRRLLSEGDGTGVFAHLVRIQEASPHYHKAATELYYVVEGSGTMRLDGEEVALRPGACIEVRPGVVHAARGDVLVLVVGVPSISDEDTYLPERETESA